MEVKLAEAERTISELYEELMESNSGMVALTLELQKAKEKYQNIFENSMLGIFQTTPDNKFKIANLAMAKILGYDSPTELITHTEHIDSQIYANSERRDIFKKEISRQGSVSDFEIEILNRNGELRWILENTRELINSKGQFQGYEGVIQDITDKKKMEEELKNYRTHLEKLVKERTEDLQNVNEELVESNRGMVALTLELQKAKEKYQNIFENSILGIFQTTSDNKFKIANLAMAKILGFDSPSELIDNIQNIDIQIYVDSERRAVLKKQIIEHGFISDFEIKIYNRKGDIRWILENSRLLNNPDGHFLGYEGVIQDITEKKKMEEELENYRTHLEQLVKERTEDLQNVNEELMKTNQELVKLTLELQNKNDELQKLMIELQRSNKELEQFAYVASHDLQEPLRMIASFTQLLQKRYQDKLDQDANDFINFAVEGAIRMQNLINDLLIFSRVGTQGKPFEETDMNIVLRSVLTNLSRQIYENDAKITSDPLPVIFADESQMLQLFQNLISNAIKFHGQVVPKVHISGEVRKNDWIFSVKDNGIGIDSKHFERIFIIFQRLHKKNEYAGTGIGLAVCKKIIQRHGGKIWVESNLGKGSKFIFTIPRNNKGNELKN